MPLGKGRPLEADGKEGGQVLLLDPARSVLLIIAQLKQAILDDWPLPFPGGRPRGIRQESHAANFSICLEVLAASTLIFLKAPGCHVRNLLFCWRKVADPSIPARTTQDPDKVTCRRDLFRDPASIKTPQNHDT